jgi:hypothetical protein
VPFWFNWMKQKHVFNFKYSQIFCSEVHLSFCSFSLWLNRFSSCSERATRKIEERIQYWSNQTSNSTIWNEKDWNQSENSTLEFENTKNHNTIEFACQNRTLTTWSQESWRLIQNKVRNTKRLPQIEMKERWRVLWTEIKWNVNISLENIQWVKITFNKFVLLLQITRNQIRNCFKIWRIVEYFSRTSQKSNRIPSSVRLHLSLVSLAIHVKFFRYW